MAFKRFGRTYPNFSSPNTRKSFDVLEAPQIGVRAQLRPVTTERLQLDIQILADVHVDVGVEGHFPPAELDRVT